MREAKTIITSIGTFVLLFFFIKNTNAQEIIIGTQTWSTKNLDVSTFRNGDIIPEVRSDSAWMKACEEGKPAWCYYDNDPANEKLYGKLYNEYAVNDTRGLAPKGWHVPTEHEWITLIEYLGGKAVAGTKMKNTSGWSNDNKINNGNGTNESGFTAFPGGAREDGLFFNIGYDGYWWSSIAENSIYAWDHYLHYGGDDIIRVNSDKHDGYSVRCIKD